MAKLPRIIRILILLGSRLVSRNASGHRLLISMVLFGRMVLKLSGLIRNYRLLNGICWFVVDMASRLVMIVIISAEVRMVCVLSSTSNVYIMTIVVSTLVGTVQWTILKIVSYMISLSSAQVSMVVFVELTCWK